MATLHAIQDYIDRHLADPDLGPVKLARVHHLSLRSLHRLFAQHGLTVAGSIRSRRLDRCRRDLADPRHRHRSVQSIGARWGLRDPAHFSRTFKAAVGMTPNEYRTWVLDCAERYVAAG